MRSLRMRDLHFGGAGVGVVGLVAADQLGLAVLGQRHVASSTNGPERRGRPGTRPPYVAEISLVEQDSTCYTRTTTGCKSAGRLAGSAIATSAPAAIEQPTPAPRRRAQRWTRACRCPRPEVAAVRRAPDALGRQRDRRQVRAACASSGISAAPAAARGRARAASSADGVVRA